MEIDKVFNNGIDGVADNLFSAVNNSVSEIKAMQQRKAAENVQLVIQALKKIDSDIRSRYDEVGNAIEKRVATIKDGRDGINGKDGKNGKDGRDGKQGIQGTKGQDGINGRDGVDGVDGVSVTSAHIDFDGSLIIGLSSGVELNVGEVLAPSLAESIKVITNGGGTSQSVLDTLASLQTQITNLIPSQTGNSGKFLTTNGTTTSWSSTPTFTSITDSGNLTFTGTGNRITGDMTTTTFTNRVAFQTTQVNGATSISAIPNGTSTASNINCYNNSDPTNASLLLAGTNATEALINSTIRGTGTYLPMTFYTSGSERARIDTSGNVGIGTSSPQAKLSVSNAGASGFEFFATYPGGGTGTYIQSYNRSGAAYVNTAYYALSHTFWANGSNRMVIDSSGNVGIGTATPTSVSNYGSLAVNGSSGAFIDAYVNGTRTGSLEADAGNVYVQSITSVPLLFRTNSTERMRITSAGNVGIGTSSPNASAILDAQSTTKGVRFPNMTTTQKNAISSPAAGLVVFDTTLSKLAVYSGTAWETITSV